jgi:hypothetical protein
MTKSPMHGMVLLCALAMLAACDRVSDLGPERVELRDVGGFERIDMAGDARLIVTIGAATAIQLEGVDSLLEATTTQVRDGTLYIDNRGHERKWFRRVRPIEVRISMPQLAELAVNGGNDVRLRGFAGGQSTLNIEGAAHVNAEGQLDRLSVHMQGAGVADLDELVAREAVVVVDGVGTAYVHATDSLSATLNGVGTILYSGDPHEVQTSMNGFGKVDRRDTDENAEVKPPAPDPDSLQPEYDREQLKAKEPPIEV